MPEKKTQWKRIYKRKRIQEDTCCVSCFENTTFLDNCHHILHSFFNGQAMISLTCFRTSTEVNENNTEGKVFSFPQVISVLYLLNFCIYRQFLHLALINCCAHDCLGLKSLNLRCHFPVTVLNLCGMTSRSCVTNTQLIEQLSAL